jgi:hypothetical protein
MLAGDRILTSESACTAGFGAYEARTQKSSGETVTAPFLLTAGHCFPLNATVYRSPYTGFGGEADWSEIGQVTRNTMEQGAEIVDGEAIRLKSAGIAPREIYGHEGNRPTFGEPEVARTGEELCFSGAHTAGVRCGKVVTIRKILFQGESGPRGCVVMAAPVIEGDSGGPVWNPKTGAAVGLVKGEAGANLRSTCVQPLLNTPNNRGDSYPGVLNAALMFDLHLMTH